MNAEHFICQKLCNIAIKLYQEEFHMYILLSPQQMHVTRGAKPPLESGYVQTVKHPVDGSYKPTVYALDCEMV